MQKEKIILGIVDDHQIVLDGLQSLLKGHEQFTVAFVSTDPTTTIDQITNTPIDILLTDIMMPVMPGNLLAKEINKRFPKVKLLALSMNNDSALVNEMIEEANISGYVLKNIGQPELIRALEKIAEGGIYFSDEVIKELERNQSNKKPGSKKVHLTSRELEIIRLIEREFNNKQIAETLYISERTVETHRKNILRKTGTNTVIGLIKFAYEHKLI